MNKMALAVILSIPLVASAQGFVDEPTCYSWNGGNNSSGSFLKCNTFAMAPASVATPAPVQEQPRLAPSPIMMPMSCPPPPVKIVPKKRKPAPKKC